MNQRHPEQGHYVIPPWTRVADRFAIGDRHISLTADKDSILSITRAVIAGYPEASQDRIREELHHFARKGLMPSWFETI